MQIADLERATDGMEVPLDALVEGLPWAGPEHLIAAIAQQYDTGEVLMMAWMSRESLRETLESGYACYWSRSRKTLWRKGETSGCRQRLLGARLDCDGDALLLSVDQTGAACHTGRRSCFYNRIEGRVVIVEGNAVQPHRGPE